MGEAFTLVGVFRFLCFRQKLWLKKSFQFMPQMKPSKTDIAIVILIIFHLVGLGGVIFGEASSFLTLTPLNLLLTFGLIIWTQVDWSSWWIIPLTWFLGYGVEVIGVNTGFPFGNYIYEYVLGWQVFNTPLIIGINWFILLYGAVAIARRLSLSDINTSLVAGGLMVILDYFIEPVAIRFNFWEWEATNPPIQNYLAWFFIAAILAFIWQRSRWQLNTKMAVAVYATQMLFFGVLNLLPQ